MKLEVQVFIIRETCRALGAAWAYFFFWSKAWAYFEAVAKLNKNLLPTGPMQKKKKLFCKTNTKDFIKLDQNQNLKRHYKRVASRVKHCIKCFTCGPQIITVRFIKRKVKGLNEVGKKKREHLHLFIQNPPRPPTSFFIGKGNSLSHTSYDLNNYRFQLFPND